MGTRGAIGFRKNGKDKVMYNHFDSYPTGIGVNMGDFAKEFTNEVMNELADKMVDVSDTKPTNEQISECAPYCNLQVSEQSTADWYCLLRDTHGNLKYLENVPYYENSNSFLEDSLFCEYAYIINLDTNCLEFYKGFNHKPLKNAGRYAGLHEVHTDNQKVEYFGVELRLNIPLTALRKLSTNKVVLLMDESTACRDDDENRTAGIFLVARCALTRRATRGKSSSVNPRT